MYIFTVRYTRLVVLMRSTFCNTSMAKSISAYYALTLAIRYSFTYTISFLLLFTAIVALHYAQAQTRPIFIHIHFYLPILRRKNTENHKVKQIFLDDLDGTNLIQSLLKRPQNLNDDCTWVFASIKSHQASPVRTKLPDADQLSNSLVNFLNSYILELPGSNKFIRSFWGYVLNSSIVYTPLVAVSLVQYSYNTIHLDSTILTFKSTELKDDLLYSNDVYKSVTLTRSSSIVSQWLQQSVWIKNFEQRFIIRIILLFSSLFHVK